jgi:hypothetical protein
MFIKNGAKVLFLDQNLPRRRRACFAGAGRQKEKGILHGGRWAGSPPGLSCSALFTTI